ncbi:helix-turn-helix domain-containing protein [Erwinia sp. 198]|uniref:helix-turn-helix domain-containing protein n=1 Tax=Erwinia sp. 198 TaxID=2022746 RepID=UPI000F660434|nr:XRE family transcriptional regulator [Erwinia sp. 198]RRZ90254.1 XRE family transcriptional regulator [Erwinia sp. 198]
MSQTLPEPGRILRALRLARGWSLTEAAAQTGVSKAMLGQVERGESSPTVATLWKIATGFNVPFSHFIADPAPESAFLRSVETDRWRQQRTTMQASPLFPFDRQLGFDMLVVEMAAGALSESSSHERGVIEHVVVIEGELRLATGAQWHTLKAGEGLRFQADAPHSYRNDGSEPVRFYSLIHYPSAFSLQGGGGAKPQYPSR